MNGEIATNAACRSREPEVRQDPPNGYRLWRYDRLFAVGPHALVVRIDTRSSGMWSTLAVDGVNQASDWTPIQTEAATRNHLLAATLPDGRRVEVEAGYLNWYNVGIAATLDGQVVHESHPGRRIAYPARAAKALRERSASGAPAHDYAKLKANRIPIAVDIALSLLFFIVAKLTNLQTAALVGAGAGIALLIAQRFVSVDLIGGMALFGIVMLLASAGFAIAVQDDELIKHRSTIVGLFGAACFLVDGLMGGKRLGRGMSRYIAYADIDERRLALGMGGAGATLALANVAMVRLLTTDQWLFYTTFADVPLSMGLVLLVIKWARSGGLPAPQTI